jgi:sialate O-acetylesterase
MQRKFLWPAVAAFTCLSLLSASAEVRLPKVFGSHMVLQQQKPMVFWGWADPGEKIEVQAGDAKAQTKANDKGEWKVALPARNAGGSPIKVIVSGSNKIEFEDVLIGEVWLCSGQSNMEMGINVSQNAKQEVADADHPEIRLLQVQNKWTPEPQKDMEGEWKVCTPKTVAEGGWGGFSAAGYYFGRELQRTLKVPVGLIDATWGGTRIESWTAPEGFAQVPALEKDYLKIQLGDPRTSIHSEKLTEFLSKTEQWLTQAREAAQQKAIAPAMPTFPAELLPPQELQNSTALFNGMIHPLCPFAIRGAIWYQGESNATEGMLYTERMKALIQGWRTIWNVGNFPFLYVQIAPFNYGGMMPHVIGEFWEAQAAAMEIPNTGMAVINDIGNLTDIHPQNKQEVGRRLALWALAKTYGKKDVLCSGPVFKSMKAEGAQLRIEFTETGSGLSSRDGKPLTWFEIIDADTGGFVQATAKVEGSSLVLSAPSVKNPVAVRFAWSMLAEPNLVNSAGLPASAFRAGTVPKRDLMIMNAPEASQYELVYDLDLSKLGPEFEYDVDKHESIKKPFDRIAYFMELQDNNGSTQFVFVSMDAFTKDLAKIGIPTAKAGFIWQMPVKSMTVISNGKGVTQGTNLVGNLEFWPNNYGTENKADVPNASGQVYDFGDAPGGDSLDGYGSMQIHNPSARQTVLAINNWKAAKGGDLGIGNQPKGNSDWTFAGNAGSWQNKRLRVLVRLK